MRSDRARNSIGQARPIAMGSNRRIIQGRLGQDNREDFFTFRLNRSSQVNVSLTGLEANANLSLLNGDRRIVRQSIRGGRQPETIRGTLEAGTYYIQVKQRQGTTRYRLSTIARPQPAPAATAPLFQNPPPPPGNFDIAFDYRFDTAGWFTPERRAVLESAASLWETIIRSEFETVPVGTMLSITHPITGLPVQLPADIEIDDVRVFVGAAARDGVGREMAIAGPSGYWSVSPRLTQRYEGNPFQPWAGSLSIDTSENWFFDTTPTTADDIPLSANDFLSVAVHELGHILGISTSRAFDNLVVNGRFTGANARAVNAGQPVPMTSDGHIAEGLAGDANATEALMDPTLFSGTRKLPTRLDVALLADIGYDVVWS